MVDRHSTAAMTELQALRLQLDSVAAGVDGIPSVDVHGIADASTFVRAASDLRVRMQSVDEEVVELFAGSAAIPPPAQAHDSIARLRAALPVAEASRMNSFASRLVSRNPSARNDVGEMQTR
jgi:hypothetical protein